MHADRLDPTIAAAAPVRGGWMRGLRNRWVRAVAALGVVLFGVFVTLSIWAEPGSPVAFHSGTMTASGRLQQVLNDPSTAGGKGGPTVGNSYTDKAGRSCRSFSQGAVQGIACRIDGNWRVIEMRQP